MARINSARPTLAVKVKCCSISCGRPYYKNDDRNGDLRTRVLVWACMSYEWLDTPAQSMAANALDDRMWLYYSLFQFVVHLESKEAVFRNRIMLKRNDAYTPCGWLLAAEALPTEQEARPTARCAGTDPRRAQAGDPPDRPGAVG